MGKKGVWTLIFVLGFWLITVFYAYLFGRFTELAIHQTVLTKIADVNSCVKELK